MTNLINGRAPEHIKAGLRFRVIGDAKCSDCAYYGTVLYEIGQREYECDDIDRDALALIEHLEAKQPRWISVEERLPWMNKKVLVTDGFIVAEAHYNGRAEWIHNGHCMETGGVIVTHWMPLPEPPKEESNA